MSTLLPGYATWRRFNVQLFTVYVLLHASVIAAVFTYSTAGLWVLLALYFITMCLGVTLGYHRLLAHRSYQTRRWLRFVLAFLAVLAFQRGPIWWVAAHRLHHSKVDKPLDPHSPAVSFLWSHFLWAFFRHPQLDESPETTHRLAGEVAEEPEMQFLEKAYTAINLAFLLGLFAAGYCWGGLKLGFSLLVWGGLLRLVFTLHVTWLVNSAAHLWGYRTYETADTSRNNWWVALFAFGEGWHNNHHADQRAARNGHRWFEIDMTYYMILLLRQVGLITDVHPISKRLKPLLP